MLKRNKELWQIKLFVATLLNKIQDEHSKLLIDLESQIGKTSQFDEVVQTLTKIYDGKIQVLDEIYKKIQDLE
jgi:hypothetical protein